MGHSLFQPDTNQRKHDLSLDPAIPKKWRSDRILYPGKRGDQGNPRKLDEETINIVLTARQPDGTPVPMLLEVSNARHLVPATTGLTTLYRLFHHHGLMDKSPKPEDRRKFEAELANDIWQSDVMHGPKVTVIKECEKPI